nr:hypothetical protein [Tanacetum cinerariifolium]
MRTSSEDGNPYNYLARESQPDETKEIPLEDIFEEIEVISQGRGRGQGYPHRGGRSGPNNILVQHGKNRLIANNIAESPSSSSAAAIPSPNDSLYKEFIEFLKSKKEILLLRLKFLLKRRMKTLRNIINLLIRKK